MKDPGSMWARIEPYAKMLMQVAKDYGLDPARFAAVGYVETWYGWAPGYSPKGSPDGWGDDPDAQGPRLPNAYGFFQIDKRWHAGFLSRADHSSPEKQARYSASLLNANRLHLRETRKTGEELERAVYAAYNASPSKIYNALARGQDVDLFTAHHNYVTRVWAVAEAIRPKLAALAAEPPPTPMVAAAAVGGEPMGSVLSAILMPLVRLVLPLVLGGLADFLINLVTGMKCPAGAQTIFCTQVWGHVVAMVVAAITYIRTHPNGLNGGPAPDAISSAYQKIVAPIAPKNSNGVQQQGETGYKDPMLP